MDIISRKAAHAAGLAHYFTGKPCSRGHIDKRHVSSWGCLSCLRENALKCYRSRSDEDRSRIYRKRKDYVQQWLQANPDRAAAMSAKARKRLVDAGYFRDYYSANKDRRKQEAQEWYRENAEYAAVRNKAYVAKRMSECPDLIRMQKRKAASNRRAITKELFVESVDPRVVFERDKGICGICLKPVEAKSKWEVDHVLPVSRGGAHSYANVQLAHRRCNRAKGAKLPA